MLARNPKTGEPIRIMRSEASLWRSRKTTVFLKDQDVSVPWDRWDTLTVGPSYIQKWESVLKKPMDIVVLCGSSEEEKNWFLSSNLAAYKMIFLSTSLIYAMGIQEFRSRRLTNVICLEELHKMYPYLGGAWDGTEEDAVLLASVLLRTRRIVGLDASKVSLRLELLKANNFDFEIVLDERPKELWFITQLYIPEKGRRAKEIRECLEKNLEISCIDKVVLLNESDLSMNWNTMKGSEKVIQHVIYNRLTYHKVLQWIYNNVPKNTLVAFANADIYLDADSWRDLWSVRTDNVFMALLRWDLQEDGEEPKLFGPRNDSQDTWVVDSDSIQKTEWNWLNSTLEFPFGKAGCDNAITVEMLKKKFLVVNPALSLKTFHNHKTNIRNYDVADVVDKPVYLYVDPTGIHDMEPCFDIAKHLDKKQVFKPFDRRIGSAQSKVLDVYCKMLERGERYLWKSDAKNTFGEESVPIYSYKNVFQTPQGLVYGFNKLLIGREDASKEAWSKSQLSPVSPTYSVEKAFAIPWRDEEVKTPEGYLLYFLSKVHLLRSTYGNGEFWAPDKAESLELFDWGTRQLPVIPHSKGAQIWCKEVIQYPWLNKQEIHREEIEALRSSLKSGWKAESDRQNRWVVVIDSNMLSVDMVRKWEEENTDIQWSVVFEGRTGMERMVEKLNGAEGIICYGGPNAISRWGLSWLLPKGATVIEIQNEMEPNGEAAHVSGAAGLQHKMVIVPRASIEATRSAITKHVLATMSSRTKDTKVSKSLPVIRVPRSTTKGFFSHAGDSFREMIRIWEEKGYVSLQEDDVMNLWLNDVLLYDRPTLDWLFASPAGEQVWKKALFGNPKPTEMGGASSPWFFWPRRPRVVEDLVAKGLQQKSYSDRRLRLVFYGKVENKVQEKRRFAQKWDSAFVEGQDEYKMHRADEAYSLTHEEYMMRLADARFGLCLAGFGKKCHREVECMAMGCIPVCASDVDMENYANPPVEGIHYLRVAKPEDLASVLGSISEQKWNEMSAACCSWWKENASAEGSWALTKKLIVLE